MSLWDDGCAEAVKTASVVRTWVRGWRECPPIWMYHVEEDAGEGGWGCGRCADVGGDVGVVVGVQCHASPVLWPGVVRGCCSDRDGSSHLRCAQGRSGKIRTTWRTDGLQQSVIMAICKAPTPPFKALSKHSITCMLYIEMEMFVFSSLTKPNT